MKPRLAVAAALLACVAAGVIWGPRWLAGRTTPSPSAQRALAGATADASPPPRFDRVRVVLVDGLSLADTDRVPAFAAVCTSPGALDLIVDVGFPTKSVPVQLALWTGLTADQLGAPLAPDGAAPPAASLPVRLPGSLAVVETYRAIAAAAGFTVEPPPAADDWDPIHTPAAVRAWRDAGFAAAIAPAIASSARLVLIHILAVDETAHAHGRAGAAYDAALRRADSLVAAAVTATPPDALLVVLSDHGHLPGGGHGDAEDVVRLVRACITPSPTPSARPATSIHLVDLSRTLFDALGIAPDPHAVGRPLSIALAHPDPGGTLPRPSGMRWSLAILLAAVMIAIGALRLGRAGWVWSWPLCAYAAFRIASTSGAPSLSTLSTAHLSLTALATAAPFLALVILALRRAPQRARAIAIATLGPAAVLATVFAVLSRVPDALVTATSPRTPTWTAHFVWSAHVVALAAVVAAVALLCPERGRPPPDPQIPATRDRGQNRP